MDQTDIPPDFVPAEFSPGFLDHGGPYYLKPGSDGAPGIVGLHVMTHHINYQNAAHGGVISTLADVALSHAVYDAQRPRLLPSTITLTTNFLAPARLGDWLEAEVALDRVARRTAYVSGAIHCGQTVIATMSGVFAIRPEA